MEIEVDYDPSAAMKNFVLKIRDEASSTKSSGFMHKVPKQLRDVNKKAYEPEVVSIGPYYHGNDELKEMEEVKVRFMKALFDSYPQLEDACCSSSSSIAEIGQVARGYYGEDMKLNPEELLKMLVLDGCLIIQLITDCTSGGNAIYIHSRLRNSLQRDLLLLENQIPFFVLCKLGEIINNETYNCRTIIERVLMFFNCHFPGGKLYVDTLERKSEEVTHILDLVHSNWCPPNLYKSLASIPITSSPASDIPFIDQGPTDDRNTCPLVIPSASKLKEVNVKFTSYIVKGRIRRQYINLVDTRFEDGKLVLPKLVIDDGTESILRNLIAYEQMLPTDEHTPVTDYALLLDYLINDATDVQVLSNKVIYNMLGSDEAVADFVNRLTYKIINHNKEFMFTKLFRCIISEYDKRKGVARWNRAKSEFREKYCNSPWSFIAVVVATVLLLLTIAQTIFDVKGHFKRP